MAREFDIMVAGHLALDITPHIPDTGAKEINQLFHPGKLINVGDAVICTGGAVSNTGIALKKLGQKACFCARVGSDELGKMTIDILQKSGHAEGISIAQGHSSSYTVVIAPPNIDRIFLHNPATNNEFSSDDLNTKLVSKCRHFHFGYPTLMRRMYENEGRELLEVFKKAKSAGATTSCDMALPDPDSPAGKVKWIPIFERLMPYMDIYLPSIEETFYMLEPEAFIQMKRDYKNVDLADVLKPEDYARLADKLLGMGTKVVGFKSGRRGFYIKTGSKKIFDACTCDSDNWLNRQLWAPAFKVDKLASATGSGDCLIAGFLAAFVRGLTIEKVIRYAICCGWQNVQEIGTTSGISDWQETTKLVEKNMPLIDINIQSDNWKFSQACQIWTGPNDKLNS